MIWLLIVINLNGGAPAIIYMETEAACHVAEAQLSSDRQRISATCISGGETVDNPEL
jgi:hypothetical protein